MHTEAAYRVRSRRPGFTVTYACAQAETALEALRRAQRMSYAEVTVLDEAGEPVNEADLIMRAKDGQLFDPAMWWYD